MRPRFAVPLSLLASVAAVAAPAAAPAVAGAHPVHNSGLTIGVTPNPITAGDSVLVYGQLKGGDYADQPITLYHRVNPQAGYSVIGHTTTNSQGFYEFPRADGVVMSNREWFVRGPGDTHSRTVHESVTADVNLSSSTASTDTRSPVTFTGAVAPGHPGQTVYLQEPARVGNRTGWHTFAKTQLNSASQFSVSQRWPRPGIRTVRALLKGNGVNAASTSDSLTVSVQQKQVPGFSAQPSAAIIPDGQSVTIAGTLDQAGTNTVEPNTSVTLLGNTRDAGLRAIATTTTDASGNYSFAPQSPTENTVYRVETTLAPHRSSAAIFEGVSDVISMTATPTSVQTGQPVSFSGTITPASAGELVYLQRQDATGNWINVGVHPVGADGSYTFTRLFAAAGTKAFRTRVYANGINVGSASAPVNVTVSGAAVAPTSLPPAS